MKTLACRSWKGIRRQNMFISWLLEEVSPGIQSSATQLLCTQRPHPCIAWSAGPLQGVDPAAEGSGDDGACGLLCGVVHQRHPPHHRHSAHDRLHQVAGAHLPHQQELHRISKISSISNQRAATLRTSPSAAVRANAIIKSPKFTWSTWLFWHRRSLGSRGWQWNASFLTNTCWRRAELSSGELFCPAGSWRAACSCVSLSEVIQMFLSAEALYGVGLTGIFVAGRRWRLLTWDTTTWGRASGGTLGSAALRTSPLTV